MCTRWPHHHARSQIDDSTLIAKDVAGCEAIFTSREFACEEYSGQLVVEVVSATDLPAMDLWVSLHSLWPLRSLNPGMFESLLPRACACNTGARHKLCARMR